MAPSLGAQLGWRGLWRPARSEQVEALQQVQARSVRIRRALRGDSPRAPQPQGAETPCAPPADASRSGENARSRVASSLAPSLNSGVLHLLRPGCGLLNHRPKIRQPREQSWGCQAGSGAAGRERGEPAASALCALSGRADGRATCAGVRRLRPGPGLGHPAPPSRREGGAGSSGPAVLAGASSLAEPLWNAAPARRASQEPAGTLFAPWRRRGQARCRRRLRRRMSCPQ